MGSFYSWLIRNSVQPIFDVVRHTSRFNFGHVLQNTQWLSRKEIESLQNQNLRILVRHAYDYVPYYRRLFRERGLSPDSIQCTEDLVKLPVLTKADIRKNFCDLISHNFPKNNIIRSRTGGTGDALVFYTTKQQMSWEIAAEYRAYNWANYRLGDRCFIFWGSTVDLAKHRSMIDRLVKAYERIHISDTYVMSYEIMGKFVHSLMKYQPEIIRGYTSSVYMIAKFILDKGINCVRPRAIITSAETLTSLRRKTIEKAFNCPVFDYYGSREIGAIAAECDQHYGYHISTENVCLEFVKNGEQVAAGEKGQILITNLRNFGMPFIRYEIGDVGIPSDTLCACGRGLPLMSSIEGRLSNFIAVYDKTLNCIVPVGPIYPEIIFDVMEVPLKSIRIEQNSLGKLKVKIVKGRGFSQKHAKLIVDYIHSSWGDDIDISFEFVDYLPPLPSGKRSSFISRINSFE